MASNYKYRPAKRAESHVVGGIYGKSGSGKTYSALLMGRGIVGPDGKLGMADTEGGRGELFADLPEIGGYLYSEITPPFTADKYIQAIEAAEAAGLECLVIDSASHAWEGEGGVLDQARASEKASGKAGLHNWNKAKQDLNKLVLKIMRTRVHLIICLRAKRKSHQVEVNEQGRRKTKVIKDGYYSPKMDEDFVSELLFNAEILGIDDERGPPHSLIVHKVTHPKVAEFFKDGVIPTKRTGELFKAWSKNDKFKVTEADKKPAGEILQRQTPATVEDRTPYDGRPQVQEDDGEEWKDWTPEGGWPQLARVGEWVKWSAESFLPNANRFECEAWNWYWRDFNDNLRQRADKKQELAIEALAKLKPLIAAAMKREKKP